MPVAISHGTDIICPATVALASRQVEVIPNQGADAAAMRIEAVRRIFNRCRFDEKKCQAGLDALGLLSRDREVAQALGAEFDLVLDGFGDREENAAPQI